jgi:TIR domain
MPSSRNKVLISWSGETSSKIATALSKFLKLTLQACEPWVSTRDIALGSYWHEELWRALGNARVGIICLTPDNVESKWLHFEAGVIAKSFGKVFTCPYLFGVDPPQVQGPLQFLPVRPGRPARDLPPDAGCQQAPSGRKVASRLAGGILQRTLGAIIQYAGEARRGAGAAPASGREDSCGPRRGCRRAHSFRGLGGRMGRYAYCDAEEDGGATSGVQR